VSSTVTTSKVSLSLDKSALAWAEAVAARMGMSAPTWITHAIRREAVRLGAGTLPGTPEMARADETERYWAEEALRAQG
jgi:hypothetical protein